MKISGHRIIVTGGAGFIGSHLVDRLLDGRTEVVVIDDFSTGSPDNLAQHSSNPLLRIEEADIRDEQAMISLFTGAQFVLHLACRNVRLSLKRPSEVHDVNITGTLSVLKASVAAKIKRFLYCSSSEVNGTAGIVPMAEEYCFRPETLYGASKLAGEYYAQVFYRAGWLETIIARPHNNYGPREHYQGHKGEVIPRFIIRVLAGLPPLIYGDGNQTRDFTYVTETADFLVKLLEEDRAVGQTFNICRGEEVSISRLAEIIVDLSGVDLLPRYLPSRPNDVLRLFGDPTRLRALLGVGPEVSIRDGLAKTLAWFKENVTLNQEVLASVQDKNWEDIEIEPWLSVWEGQRQEGYDNVLDSSRNVIPVARPFFNHKEVSVAAEAIRSGWVTQGPRVKAFEDAFAEYVGADYACAVSSCTAGLHLALRVVGVKPGDVVVTVSHSFIATANAVRHCQAEPYFIDINIETLNMDLEHLVRVLTEDFQEQGDQVWLKDPARLALTESPFVHLKPPIGRLGAILVVHQVGLPSDMAGILAVAKKYRIPVVEDAACAIGSEIFWREDSTWQKIGRPHGEVACFSFHPRKIVTTGDGGMLTTQNHEYYRQLCLLRHHGMSISDVARHQAKEAINEEYLATGYNYRLTDIQAAVGLEQLKKLPKMIRRRRQLVEVYRESLEGVPGLKTPFEPSYTRTNWQSYVVRLKDASKQREVIQMLLNRGVVTRRGIMCAHLEAPYTKAWPRGTLPQSEIARDSCIVLPLYHQMRREDCRRVAGILCDILK